MMDPAPKDTLNLKKRQPGFTLFSFSTPSALSPITLDEKQDYRTGNHVQISFSLLHLSEEVDRYLEIILSFLYERTTGK